MDTTTPSTNITLTIRLIKSFEFRNFKNVVVHVDTATTTPQDLAAIVKQKVDSEGGLRPYRTVELDTFKLYTKAFGAKTQNLIINLDHDEDWILDMNATLAEQDGRMGGFENETEISFFNKAAYDSFKAHPETKW
ncbi:hypothetical protein CcCBS67573_g08255 [Chytriomyces confervae]|uniref:Uncharacterized protein n=1 Tax=Chytriomyces confervae TaxID=246404 RepID=A0A507ENS1_9FUNG|nr:hypothetical protein CcCBS67573_g08255 [Chytriomyces confervae]